MKCYSMLNKLLLTLFITAMSQNSLAAAVDNFVIQVQTDLHVNVPSTSDDSSFTIRTKPGVTYNYNVDCNNDGVFESINKTGDFTCVYQGPDEYIIRIEDNVGDGTGFPQIYYNNAGDTRKITDIIQWGTGKWISMAHAFHGSDEMGVSAADVPDLTLVTNMSKMFSGATSANPGVNGWNTSSVNNMFAMFEGATLADPDVSGWNTSNVANMDSMFSSASSANPDVSGWNTINVKSMGLMFRFATSANPDVSNWNTSNVMNMRIMFRGATSAIPDMSNWNITGITTPFSMENILQGVTLPIALYDATLANFNAQITANGIVFNGGNSKYCNATARDSLISTHGWTITDGGPTSNCPSSDDFVIEVDTTIAGSTTNTQFEINTTGTGYNYNVDCDGANAGINTATGQTGNYTCNYATPGFYTIRISDNVGDKTGFPRFYLASHDDGEKITDLKQWGTGVWSSMGSAFHNTSNMIVSATDVPDLSNVTDMSSMFYNAILANPNTSNWNTSSVTQMQAMFFGAASTNPDVSSWNTSSVTNMSSMFYNATLANPNTSNWNTSSVTNMVGMFYRADSANPDVSSWNTSSVVNMNSMFYNATLANPYTSNWNTSSVTNMSRMFSGATSANPDVSNWNTSSVTNMSWMFSEANSANPDVSNWNTSSVTNMIWMFYNATLVNPNTSNWNTSSVTNMSYMFSGATSANPDVSNWNTSSVTNMIWMFSGATSANPDVSNWNTSSVTHMNFIFKGATSSDPNVSNWNTSSVTNMGYMFYQATSANPDVSGWDVTNVTTMEFMFSGLTLATVDYDNILKHFSSQLVMNNVPLGGGNSKFCAIAAHDNLSNNHSWTITDGLEAAFCYTATDFVITVDTSIAGASTATQFTLPTTGSGYNYNIYCDIDDATAVVATAQNGNFTCNYASAGIYTIRIEDNTGLLTGFPRIYFNNSGDKDKIIAVNQWGSGIWSSMNGAFYGASNLLIKATDTPELSGVTDMSLMFTGATLANPNTNGWNTSNVDNMSSMFASASAANPDTSTWNTANVTDMSSMFLNATSAQPNTSSWDVSGVNSFANMFLGVTLPTALYDAILINFNAQSVQAGLSFHGGNSKYCAVAAHDGLDITHGWTLNDGGQDTLVNCTPQSEDIFSNGFEDVIIFKAAQSQFSYDFSEVSITEMDEEPLLIAQGVDEQHKPVIHIYLRNDVGQLQIRLDKILTQDGENVHWTLGQWQSIDNKELTTISW